MNIEKRIQRLQEASKLMRKNILELIYGVGNKGCHVSPNLSPVEILATLYLDIMKINVENYNDRDRFILGKGHAGLALYVALYHKGLISKEILETFDIDGSVLPGQVVKNEKIGLEFSSGSLGHALSLGVGVALAGKRKNADYKVYVLLGDGECNEGAIWEAALSASHFSLDNLVVIVDCNGMQSDGTTNEILNMGDFASKWHSFGFETVECDGHSVEQILESFQKSHIGKPKAILAKTIKGKGISFIEGVASWHHNFLTKENYEKALAELEVLNDRI